MKRIAICASTVTINGTSYHPRSTIWSGLLMHRATLAPDHLRVPWRHIDDAPTPGTEALYRLRPKEEALWWFVQSRSGAFVLEEMAL